MREAADLDSLLETLKRAAAALESERIPYLLGGGLGCWARGGPPSSNDIDLMIKREDAERALAALAKAGMRPERPPVREQIDWRGLRQRTSSSPFAAAFFTLVDGLEISPASSKGPEAGDEWEIPKRDKLEG